MKRVNNGQGQPKRNWGGASQAVQDRVAHLEAGLRQGPPHTRPGQTFDEIRVDLGEPNATDSEIEQAALDAGLTVEEH